MSISVGLGAVAVKNRVDSYPGLGREAVRVVQIVGPEGVVDVLDVQPSMLDATRQRAQRHRLYNVVTSTADASDRFPYPDATFDAAPDERGRGDPRAAADPGRTHRVLKPTGRLVVGEVVVDPDFVSVARLRTLTERRRVSAPASVRAEPLLRGTLR